jgi:peptidoglycan/LPS O-acetylase OafA/YrhL
MSSSSNKLSGRFELLDLARGFAAFGILLFHAYPVPVFSTLYTFVDFFFVLSGFVLAPAYLRVVTLREASQFLVSRAYRLFPMVFATLLFALGIQVIVDLKHAVLGEINNPRVETGIFTLLFAFGLLQIFSNAAVLLNPPLWSLSAEWLSNFFVLSRPIFRRLNPLFFLVIGCLLIWHYQFSGHGWEEQFGRAISGFYFGIILRQLRNRKNLGSRTGLLLSSVVVVLMNISIYFVGPKLSYFSPLTYGLAIIQLSYVSIRSNSSLAKVSTLFGRYSYGFYAWHFPLLSISAITTKKLLNQLNFSLADSGHLIVLLCFALTITFTHMTLKYVETPLRHHRAKKIA